MSEDVRLAPPGPHLELARIASTDDDRISNLLVAFAQEEGPAADVARWALLSLQRARASHHAIAAIATEPMVLDLAKRGLETAPE